MAEFRVNNIVDGDTFDVSNKWKWNGKTGSRVRPTGYDAPELNTHEGQEAKNALQRLLLGETVDLRKAYLIDRSRLVCDVYFNGKYLADYFPQYQ